MKNEKDNISPLPIRFYLSFVDQRIIMQNTNTTIKRKAFQFSDNEITYYIQVVYDTSPFGYGDKSFFKARIIRINGELLSTPLEYKYTQHRGWIQQSKKFREHSYYCTPSKKEVENKTNIYPLIKEQLIYQYTNRQQIQKYESQINDFSSKLELKCQPQLQQLQEQKRALKLKLKSGEIDNKEYQKLYTPIRKSKDKLEFHIYIIQRNYRERYFKCGRLKEGYKLEVCGV